MDCYIHPGSDWRKAGLMEVKGEEKGEEKREEKREEKGEVRCGCVAGCRDTAMGFHSGLEPTV